MRTYPLSWPGCLRARVFAPSLARFLSLLFLSLALPTPARAAVPADDQIESVSILYDADGNRVGKTVQWRDEATGETRRRTEKYLVDELNPTGFAQVVGVVAQEASGRASVTERALFGRGPIGVATSARSVHFLTDAHGSVRSVADEAGNLDPPQQTTAWGVTLETESGPVSRWAYAGEEWDPDLGMYWLRARYYQPSLGRFSSMDSFEGREADPLSLHKFG
ncbi:MAG: RHS repeat-associated core domain-containing protein [Verrucomicrobia bacterium]|nr:RHS repeat-associated core domain-containing protein [Verrucomicrobiota bacterium]MBI3868898.1 RHS repeat-associated core domain-containing protein [Verrucomicrobiota bacterium]